MEIEGEVDTAIEINESPSMKQTSADEEKMPIDEFLSEVGLATPLDFVFQNFAIQKSRINVSKMASEELMFLFHVMRNEDLKADNPFPRCAFLEKILPSDPSLPSKYIIWSVEESEIWKTRKQLPFTDFHLYFGEVLYPNLGYSAEELYKVFDARHDETYFINNGPRKQSVDKKFHVLFVTSKAIVAIQIPEVKYEEIPEEVTFICKWISLKEKSCIKLLHEYAVFEFAKRNLVFTEEEKQEYKTNMETIDEGKEICKDCLV